MKALQQFLGGERAAAGRLDIDEINGVTLVEAPHQADFAQA